MVAVLGIGESIKLFSPERYTRTFGVNDIARYYHVNELLITDHPTRFDRERIEVMKSHKYDVLHACHTEWFSILNFNEFSYIDLKHSKDYDNNLCCSITSAFPCLHLACKSDSKEIDIYGVDIINHWNFGVNERKKDIIERDFTDLVKYYRNKGKIITFKGEGLLSGL